MESLQLPSSSKKRMSSSKLTFDELISKCCGKISYEIGSDWFRWGRHLGLRDSFLDNNDSDHLKCYEKAENVLKKWKQINGCFSWDQLKKKLIDFERLDIVVEIEKEFGDHLSSQKKLRYMDFDFSEQARKEFKKDRSEICTALKSYYLKQYGKINEIQPPLKIPENVNLINKFVDLCIVDTVNTQMDIVFMDRAERNDFLKKKMSYTPVPYSEIFTNEKSVILISGIAGIGKTWLLRKCLLDWSNNLIWNNIELVFYLECRRVNQYQNVSNINELLNVFYKDIINDFNISNHTSLFLIDGLDEFKYLKELSDPSLACKYPIVNALAEIRKYKSVVAGRIKEIDECQNIFSERSDKLTIQIMGFNENGINSYIENNVTEEKKDVVKATLKESHIAKAMSSVPFYLSCMCKIISDSNKIYTTSFLTMTDLYANIFLYFLQKHIIKSNELVYQMMANENNKKYVLSICRIAYELFIENKVIFSKEEVLLFMNDFNEVEESLFGFIERVETHLGYHYEFAHLTIMEFCASVYAYNCLSIDDILDSRLHSCLPMICGLSNKNQTSLLKFLNLNPSKKPNEKSIILHSILDRVSESLNDNFFFECLYESQSFTDEIKYIVTTRCFGFGIWINEGNTSYITSCTNYFVKYYIKSGKKFRWLIIKKKDLSDEEKNILVRCSTNVEEVHFFWPVKIEGWKPKHNIKVLNISISHYLITKNDFEENFLSWINLCEKLDLQLHGDTDFIKDICEWICCLKIKKFVINYRGKEFHYLDELRTFITQKNV